jgi:hypothetical protein
MKKLSDDEVFSLTLTTCMVIIILIFLGYLLYFHKKPLKLIPKIEFKQSYDTIPVTITTYQPTKEQCGNNKAKTFTGDKIKQEHSFSWVAVSQDLLDYYFNFGDTIYLYTSDKSLERISGTYIIKDKTADYFRNDSMSLKPIRRTVDILSLNKFNFKIKGYILKKK